MRVFTALRPANPHNVTTRPFAPRRPRERQRRSLIPARGTRPRRTIAPGQPG